MCPAAPLTEGALLFGMVDRRGQVSYSQAAIPVTKKLLVELPVAAFGQDDAEEGLPSCSIRPQCRWYLQDGPQMCSHCRIHSRVLF